jgi:hypothetical protein
MKTKKIHRLFFYIICFVFTLLFFSCDKVVPALQKEFDSEKLKKVKMHPVALSQLSTFQDPIPYLKYSNVFIMQSESFLIEPVVDQINTYKIVIKTSPSILNFGGKEKILLKTINNLVFINRWAQGSFNLGAIVLFNDSYTINAKSGLNVFLFSPSLDVDDNTFTFLFKPEGIMQESFLSGNLQRCMLIVYSEEENF